MILPIVAYGDAVLKTPAKETDKNYPKLNELIKDMFDTMYNAKGVGLAAPQIGKSLRLFIVDGTPFAEDDEPGMDKWKVVFINPEIIEEQGKEWAFNEGCLSIPTVREDIYRNPKIRITYYDEDFKHHDEYFDGLKARIIQHEYDHIEGVLFTDKISGLKKRLLKNKLANISKGFVEVHYKMSFPLKKGR
ncbi:MAG: peptide deformylase [Bacteroidetes bacterium]|nr:peptide deformylase [Bacteroidota bacterium]HET6243087.1 peptide deformylase [Bacteroidia bacterium]